MPKRIDYTGRQIGTFTILEPASRKRYWKVKCEREHISERRADIAMRTRPELLRCDECVRPKPDITASRIVAQLSSVLTPEILKEIQHLKLNDEQRESLNIVNRAFVLLNKSLLGFAESLSRSTVGA